MENIGFSCIPSILPEIIMSGLSKYKISETYLGSCAKDSCLLDVGSFLKVGL